MFDVQASSREVRQLASGLKRYQAEMKQATQSCAESHRGRQLARQAEGPVRRTLSGSQQTGESLRERSGERDAQDPEPAGLQVGGDRKNENVTSDGVQATRAAVDTVGAAVQTFAQRARQIDDEAAASGTRFEDQVAQEHSRRVEELHRARASREAAEAALRACTENCGGLESALAAAVREEERARRRADASAKALAQVGEAI